MTHDVAAVLTYGQLLEECQTQLKEAGISDADREARILIQETAGFDRSALMLRDQDPCPADLIDKLRPMITRRCQGEPVYRILAKREFHGHALKLSADTLEPRDDTETLIDLVLAEISDRSKPVRFWDMGTGTGAIAIALMSELPKARCRISDISAGALATAQENFRTSWVDATKVEVIEADWFELAEPRWGGRFDFIVSNPPYISRSIVETLADDVRLHDPLLALDGGEDGLDAYRKILDGAAEHLTDNGFLALEIGFDQLDSLRQLADLAGYSLTRHQKDLAGNDRAVILRSQSN